MEVCSTRDPLEWEGKIKAPVEKNPSVGQNIPQIPAGWLKCREQLCLQRCSAGGSWKWAVGINRTPEECRKKEPRK